MRYEQILIRDGKVESKEVINNPGLTFAELQGMNRAGLSLVNGGCKNRFVYAALPDRKLGHSIANAGLDEILLGTVVFRESDGREGKITGLRLVDGNVVEVSVTYSDGETSQRGKYVYDRTFIVLD